MRQGSRVESRFSPPESHDPPGFSCPSSALRGKVVIAARKDRHNHIQSREHEYPLLAVANRGARLDQTRGRRDSRSTTRRYP